MDQIAQDESAAFPGAVLRADESEDFERMKDVSVLIESIFLITLNGMHL